MQELTVGVKELRRHLPAYIRGGDVVVITNRGRVAGFLVPVHWGDKTEQTVQRHKIREARDRFLVFCRRVLQLET